MNFEINPHFMELVIEEIPQLFNKQLKKNNCYKKKNNCFFINRKKFNQFIEYVNPALPVIIHNNSVCKISNNFYMHYSCKPKSIRALKYKTMTTTLKMQFFL